MKRSIALFTVLLLIASGFVMIQSNSGSGEITLNYQKNEQETIGLAETTNDGIFTENLGQWNDELLFIGDTSFGQIGLGKGCVYYNMREFIDTGELLPGLESVRDSMDHIMFDPMMEQEKLPTKVEVKGHVIKYTFEGALDVAPVGVGERNHKSNYFYGSDPDGWVRGARNFETVVYENLYEDIDLKYYFSEKGAKYDLILNPGAEPDDIRIQVDGHDSMRVENGDLKFGLGSYGSIQDKDLVAYERNSLSIIPSHFCILNSNTFGFELGPYDPLRTNVIDPMVFSTFLGGSGTESGESMTFDSNDDLIIFFSSSSSDFPVSAGAYDRFLNGTSDITITKMDSDGSNLQWSTFIGGSISESALASVLDDEENIWIRGTTLSSDFPTTSGAFRAGSEMKGASDIFVLKLKNDGSDLLASTLIGGDGSDSSSQGGLVLKQNGNPVSISYSSSSSPNFPTTAGAFDRTLNGSTDGVVFEFQNDCTDLVFSTFIGGIGSDTTTVLRLGPDGEIWLGGSTSSTDFFVTNDALDKTLGGANDIFIMNLKSDGSDVLYSTFIGGVQYENMVEMIFGSDNDIYITGNTASSDFPKTVGQPLNGQNDNFVMKIKSDLSKIDYCRLMGGTNSESGYSHLRVNNDDEVVVLGTTMSTDFPTSQGAFDSIYGGGTYDVYIYTLSSDGSSIIGSTYFGGDGTDSGTLELGPNGEIYIAGQSNSTNLYTTSDADDMTYNGENDLYFAEFSEDLTSVEYCTYHGGSSDDYGKLFLNPSTFNLYIVGYTFSSNFPSTPGAYDTTMSGTIDGYVTEVLEGVFGEPLEVYNINTYEDEHYSIPKTSFDLGDMLYIELLGEDSDINRSNGARVNISFGFSNLNLQKKTLKETDVDTGIYQGEILISPLTSYCDTITISSRKDPSKTSEIFIEPPFRPSSVSLLEVFSDQVCTVSTDKLDKGDTGYVKIIGVDSNPGMQNKALVNLTLDLNSSFKIPIVLEETSMNSGIFIGDFLVPPDMDYFENFTLSSVRNDAITDTFMIHTPVQIRPLEDVLNAYEDEEYRVTYTNFGYEPGTWTPTEIAPWLNWNETSNELYGTPNNNHVGIWDTLITLEDAKGHEDSHDYVIEVINKDPFITVDLITQAIEGEDYYCDFNCTDDGQGEMEWSMIGSAPWLTLGANTGVLSGRPTMEDAKTYNLTIVVRDGHEGVGSLDFQLNVTGKKKAPRIESLDITKGKQGENYYRDYEAYDPDGNENDLVWSLLTDAEFLTMDTQYGILEGTPGKADVGVFNVIVTVTDKDDLSANHTFDLTIENINDRPEWEVVPEDQEVIHGQWFNFDVNATDPDPGGFIEYSLTSDPETNISINSNTGELEWYACIGCFDSLFYDLEVILRVSDGELFNIHTFYIEVIPTQSPSVTLWGPDDGGKMPSSNCMLEWAGTDPEEEPLTYDIYVHATQAYVSGFREEALYLSDFDGTTLDVSSLDPGVTYYWMVIPFDGGTHGECTSGVYSFRMNWKPEIDTIQPQDAKTGEGFSLKVPGSDKDAEDSGNLVYTLNGAPSGMTITEGTGVIKWTPGSDQKGDHTINIEVTDGVETTTANFDIEVTQGEGGGFPVMIVVIISVVILLIILVIVIFVLFRKKEHKDEVDEESEEIAHQIEEHQKEVEWEHEHYEHHEETNSSISTTATEAHAHDKDKKYNKPNYEDLYGSKAPEMEEGDVSAGELKDSLKQAAEDLEKMDLEEKDAMMAVGKMEEEPKRSEPPKQQDHFLDDLISHMPKTSSDTQVRGQELEAVEQELRPVDDPYDHFGDNEEDIEK